MDKEYLKQTETFKKLQELSNRLIDLYYILETGRGGVKTKEIKEEITYIEKQIQNTIPNYDILTAGMDGKSSRINGKEILTDKKMQELFRSNYSGINYYNFDKNHWKTNIFFNEYLWNQSADTKFALEAKTSLESKKTFKDLELVALVVMPVLDKHSFCFAETVKVPRYVSNSKAAAGNLVFRDKKTGDILQPKKDWIGISRYNDSKSSAQYMAYNFGQYCAREDYFIKKLLKQYSK